MGPDLKFGWDMGNSVSDLEVAQSSEEAPSHWGPTEDGFRW